MISHFSNGELAMNWSRFKDSLLLFVVSVVAGTLVWLAAVTVSIPVIVATQGNKKWITVIGFLAVFGGFGGILGTLGLVAIPAVLKAGIKDYGSAKRLLWATIVGMLMGAGGAIAFGVILEGDGKLQGSLDDDKLILLAGIGVAIGYVGNKMLKRVGEQL